MGEFDDLIPQRGGGSGVATNEFADLIPSVPINN